MAAADIDEDGHLVRLPSGAIFKVLTQGEVDYLVERVGTYTHEFAWTNPSDLQDVDRMLIQELMVFRWGLFLSLGKDYFGDAVDEQSLRKSLNDYCVDAATEAMTQDGWKTYDTLVPGDSMFTLNTETGLAEWQPLRDVHVFEGHHSVVEFSGRDHDSLTTPNHRWPVRGCDADERDTGEVRWVESWRLLGNHSIIRAAQGAAPLAASFSDAFVELVAWYWTEGSSHLTPNGRRYNGRIHQSWKVNPGYCESIRMALTEHWGAPFGDDGLPQNDNGVALWVRCDRSHGMTEFRLSRTALAEIADVFCDIGEKVLKKSFLVALTQPQLELFISRSVDADGCSTHWPLVAGAGRGRALYQASEARADQFSFACILAGYIVSQKKKCVTIAQRRACSPIRAMAIKKKPATFGVIDLVWCPETDNATWFARRNGTHYFTGNSSELRQLKKAIGMDKLSRDKERSEDSVAAYLDKLRMRAAEFGVMRNQQCDKALELSQHLIALWQLWMNCDEIERNEQKTNAEDVMEWIGSVYVPEFQSVDDDFRNNKQKYWVGEL